MVCNRFVGSICLRMLYLWLFNLVGMVFWVSPTYLFPHFLHVIRYMQFFVDRVIPCIVNVLFVLEFFTYFFPWCLSLLFFRVVFLVCYVLICIVNYCVFCRLLSFCISRPLFFLVLFVENVPVFLLQIFFCFWNSLKLEVRFFLYSLALFLLFIFLIWMERRNDLE